MLDENQRRNNSLGVYRTSTTSNTNICLKLVFGSLHVENVPKTAMIDPQFQVKLINFSRKRDET